MSHYHVAHNQRYGTVLLGHLTTVAEPMSGQHGRRYTVAACPHDLYALIVLHVRMSCKP
jgi:hypothetical protein